MDNNWTEPILLQREYRLGVRKSPLIVRLGFPRRTQDDDEWACSFQVTGLKDNRIRVAHGVDGLQALTIAARAIRALLDRSKNVTSDHEPYEFTFPQFVPISYGLEFHRHLCQVLKIEIEKRERAISKKRLGRRKRR